MTKLLLLDCDGTIREPVSNSKFIQHPHDQRLIKEAEKTIIDYHGKGWAIYGITNQGGVAAGHKSLDDAIKEQFYTLKLIPAMSGIYFCPDFKGDKVYFTCEFFAAGYKRSNFPHPNVPSELLYSSFRKPGSGMLMLAIDFLEEYPSEILMVGDRHEDHQAAEAANINFLWAEDWYL